MTASITDIQMQYDRQNVRCSTENSIIIQNCTTKPLSMRFNRANCIECWEENVSIKTQNSHIEHRTLHIYLSSYISRDIMFANRNWFNVSILFEHYTNDMQSRTMSDFHQSCDLQWLEMTHSMTLCAINIIYRCNRSRQNGL